MLVTRHIRRRLLTFSIAAVGFFICSFSSVPASDFTGSVVAVLDGDTIEILNGHHAERIRLSGIDCPEKGQAYGKNAKHAASRLAFGKDVTIQTHATTSTDAPLLMFSCQMAPTSIRNSSSRAGVGGIGNMHPLDAELEKLEKGAREAKKGLWVDPAPIPPWVYRKARRGQSLDLSDMVPLDAETEFNPFTR